MWAVVDEDLLALLVWKQRFDLIRLCFRAKRSFGLKMSTEDLVNYLPSIINLGHILVSKQKSYLGIVRVVEKVEHWCQCNIVGRALIFRIEIDATGINYKIGKRYPRVLANIVQNV